MAATGVTTEGKPQAIASSKSRKPFTVRRQQKAIGLTHDLEDALVFDSALELSTIRKPLLLDATGQLRNNSD